MKYFSDKEKSYKMIIELLCRYKGISSEELCRILKDEECRYVFFLLLKKYNCIDLDNLKRDFSICSIRKINYNIKKAQQKLFFNKKVRDMYFEAEDVIEKTY